MAKLPRELKRRGITIKDCLAFIKEYRGVGGLVAKIRLNTGAFKGLLVSEAQRLTQHIVVPK